MWCVIGCQMSLTGTMSTRRARPDRPVKVRQRTREVLGCTQRGGQKDEGEAFTGDTARQEPRMGHVERTQGPNQKPV